MALKFAYTQPNGIVAIVYAAPKEALAPLIGKRKPVVGPRNSRPGVGSKELSDEDYRAHVLERSIPKGATDVVELPENWTPPTDRADRHTWKIKNGKVISEK